MTCPEPRMRDQFHAGTLKRVGNLHSAIRYLTSFVVFLVATAATSVTGFLFPFHRFMPSHGVGIVSLIVLALAIFARYVRHLAGRWSRIYALSAVLALYLNVFVLIVQLFEKVPALKALAPTQSEPPFKAAQLVVLALFVGLAIVAAIKFRSEQVRVA